MTDAIEEHRPTFRGKHTLADLQGISAFDSKEANELQTEVNEITRSTQMWPGLLTQIENWRERNSATFTSDIFGRTESHAVVRTLYDRVCRRILNELVGAGFDIGDYKDESGKFSINADRIGQLVVGENVTMSQNSQSDAPETAETDRETEVSG